MLNAKQVKAALMRYASRQKRNLIYRAINPARYCFDLSCVKLGRRRAIKNTATRPIRVALISDLGAYCSEEQFNPFSTYRLELRNKLQLISLHLLLKDALRAPKLILSHFDIIALKMSFRTNPFEALRVVRTIRNAVNSKRIIYFDGDDDLGVQWPEILSYVDLYIKKHIFRDKSNYLKPFIGKSNLHDYVHHKYGYSFSTRDYGNCLDGYTMISESGPVPIDQLGKIILGFNLALDRYIINLRKDLQHRVASIAEGNDIIFRGSVAQDNWSYYLRKDIAPVLRRLKKSYRVIMPTKRVGLEEYYHEMMSSKICISPFGYGEICWRDFEAMLCRCLLIKPDMSHVETNPDIFQPYKTYVPVKWDFSDLEEKCIYYLTHEGERKRIVSEGFRVLDEFYRNDGFIKSVSRMLGELKMRVQSPANMVVAVLAPTRESLRSNTLTGADNDRL
jgi:Glycosyl transferases group 1